MKYSGIYSNKKTPQSLPVPGMDMVKNNAGGYAFAVDKWERLNRFLILGSENGTYYVTESKLGRENAENVISCIKEDGKRVIDTVINYQNRVMKNSTSLFTMALASSLGDSETKKYAFDNLAKVARIGTHLFEYIDYVNGLRGFGRGLRNAISDWYLNNDKLAYHLIKYQSREGWSHKDVLRLAHVKPNNETSNILLHWAVKGWESVGDIPHENDKARLIWAFEKAKTASNSEVINLIREYNLPREAIPTHYLKDSQVWAALLERMPITAMIRNLATLTRVGLLTDSSSSEELVINRLNDSELLRKARIHPINLLEASLIYKQGTGFRSNATWKPCPNIVQALDKAYYNSFSQLDPSNKRVLYGLDVSGSMSGTSVNGIPFLDCRQACGVLSLASCFADTSKFIAFDTSSYELGLNKEMSVDNIVKLLARTGGGGTNCSLPITWATAHNYPVDAFVILTDSETWYGDTHPVQAMKQYRKKLNIPAKLITVAMASNNVSIGDSNDAGTIDVVGFDTNLPKIIQDFISEG